MTETTLEDALDGLVEAANYCDDNGLHDLAEEIAGSYQRLGADSDDWEKEDLVDDECGSD